MTDMIPEIIDMARRAGLESVAKQLDYLYNLPVDNGDDPMNPKTVKLLVTFMCEHPELATDAITMNSEGYVHASWDIAEDSELDVQFLPSGNVLFDYTTDEPDSDRFKILKNGDASPNDMLKTIMPLIKHPA